MAQVLRTSEIGDACELILEGWVKPRVLCVQLRVVVGMLITMIGLVIDDKMPRDPQEPDWAANNIFFFGAAALALISANALRSPKPKKS
ncbi:MAG: hypothetical protein V3R34_06600 [Hyphomicrobium sp.]